jgi:hypothetical protein
MNTVPDEIRRELAPLEQVLWTGRPRQGLVLRASDAIQIPFAIFWCGFIAFWEHGVMQGGNWFFMLWGVPFIVIGVHLLVGRFFIDAWLRKHTCHALTDQRVLIVTTLFSRKVRSLELKRLGEMNLSERSRGNGSIVFGRETSFDGEGGWPGSTKHAAPRFDLIDDARGVQRLVRDAAARA